MESDNDSFIKPHRRKLATTTTTTRRTASAPSSSFSHTPQPDDEFNSFIIPKPLINIISLQSNFISTVLSFFSFPFITFLSMATGGLHRAEEDKEGAEDSIARVPARVVDGSGLILRRIGFGFLGAVYVCLVLVAVMCVAVLVGVGLVQMWVEEPVILRETVHFDYTEVHPTAVFSLGDGRKKKGGVPVGHTFYVSLVLLMPESDYNRQIGIFQVTAEIISDTGNVIARSSQPCMLRFRSLPIRLMRTFILGIPLLLGLSGETQKITVPILNHKEGMNQRSGAIRAILQPRAGTYSVPELYSSEILMNSQLPWRKQLVRNWKWTFYVWTSLYVYVMLLIIILCCYKSFFFPTTTRGHGRRDRIRDWSMEEITEDQRDWSAEEVKDRRIGLREDHVEVQVSDTLKRWQEIKSRRRALLSQDMFTDQTVGSSASSVTYTTREEDMSEVVDDSGGFGDDDESVCF